MKEVNEELEGERPVWCSEHGRWECDEHFEDGNTDDREPIEHNETGDACDHQYREIETAPLGVKCIKCDHFVGAWE